MDENPYKSTSEVTPVESPLRLGMIVFGVAAMVSIVSCVRFLVVSDLSVPRKVGELALVGGSAVFTLVMVIGMFSPRMAQALGFGRRVPVSTLGFLVFFTGANACLMAFALIPLSIQSWQDISLWQGPVGASAALVGCYVACRNNLRAMRQAQAVEREEEEVVRS